MWQDPIVAEIHRILDKISQDYGNDLHAIFAAAQRGDLSNPPSLLPSHAGQQGVAPDTQVSHSLQRRDG